MRIVIAEDSVLLREGLIHLLARSGHEVIDAVEDADALITAVTSHAPDITILDVRMPPGFRDEGVRAAVRLRQANPRMPVVVLSQYVESVYAAELLGENPAGVGYLLKDRVGDVAEFVSAIETVASGGTVIDPEVIRQLLARRALREKLTRLTAREQEVLALMAEGQSNRAIATRLVVSDAAVAKHINSIFSKLDLPPETDGHRRVIAVHYYLQRRTSPEAGLPAK
ncbi:MAG: response regulator transcription factor [Actinomycetales bacterium]|nr:response regulator transcription factor [Actinomycetales bacterium]